MLDFLSDPPWWVILLIGWAMPSYGWLRAQLPRLAQLPNIVSSAHSDGWRYLHSKLRAFFRGREKKRLQKIKAARFHSTEINRKTARSYAYLVLFIVSAFFYFSGVGMIGMDGQQPGLFMMIWGALMGPFVLVFEFLWLIASGQVDSIVKYRKKIRRRDMRLV